MKYKNILGSLIFSLFVTSAFAQKPALDTSILYQWPSVDQGILSPDGNYAGYVVKKAGAFNQSPTYFLKATNSSWEKQISGVSKADFTADSRRAVYQVGETLHIFTLGTDQQEDIPQISNYQLFKNGTQENLLYYSKPQRQLAIRRGGQQESYTNVDAWLLSADGSTLLKKTNNGKDKQMLSRIDLNNKQEHTIWEGQPVSDWAMDDSGKQVVFSVKDWDGQTHIWYNCKGQDQGKEIANDKSGGIEKGLVIGRILNFTKDGSQLFFNLKEATLPKPDPNKVAVDIWSYRDAKLQSQQLKETTSHWEQSYLAMITLQKDFSVTRLQPVNATSARISPDGNYVLFNKMRGEKSEYNWSTAAQYHYDLVNTRTGKKSKIDGFSVIDFSPKGRFLLLLNVQRGELSTYELSTGRIRPLTEKVPIVKMLINDEATYLKWRGSISIGGWLRGDERILINDYYDLWELDPLGKSVPVNLTHYEGVKTRTTFAPAVKYAGNLIMDSELVVSAFDHNTKRNGFYRLTLHKEQVPEKLTMGPFLYYTGSPIGLGEPIIKATDAQVYLVSRQSISESPNYFVTKDFKTFRLISDIYPEKGYNWTRSKLINFKTADGRNEQGVLYMPENFDPHKKYPLIFHYYEKMTELLNFYHNSISEGTGGGMSELNIAWFTSHGYLVFTPDFHYKLGEPGEGVLQTVEGAIKLLKTYYYVDSHHIGLQGHSYGGWETNYLITHSQRFAAAISSAGVSDMISAYTALWGSGASKLGDVEDAQYRMGTTLWEYPDHYIHNSPVYYANEVKTPLMLIANKRDGNVPFTQSLEFFTALRRLGKKAWMVQYDRESHGEFNQQECLDYLIRSTQFFDYYLKGVPAPKWMVEGIPATRKQIDNGLELEPIGVEPGPGLLTPEAQKKLDALKHRKPIAVTFN